MPSVVRKVATRWRARHELYPALAGAVVAEGGVTPVPPHVDAGVPERCRRGADGVGAGGERSAGVGEMVTVPPNARVPVMARGAVGLARRVAPEFKVMLPETAPFPP